MDPIWIGILICIGFMGFVITMMRIVLKARKLRRQQQEEFDKQDPFKQEY